MIEAVDESVSIPDRQRALLGYYQLALDTSAHRTAAVLDELHKLRVLVRASGKRDAGLAFVDELVVAQAHPESDKRSSARKSLARRVRANQGTWIELWSRLAIGVSMMGEPETELNERGVIELIHVVVRLRHISQPMAELAAQVANEYLSRTQRTPWGNELMLEALGGSSE